MAKKVVIPEFRPEDMLMSCTWIIIGPPSTGKCMSLDTQVLMADGTVRMIQDIQIGDFVMGDDSTPRRVSKVFRGRSQLYKYEPTDGSSAPIYVTENHTLSLKYNNGAGMTEHINETGNYSRYRVKYPAQIVDNSNGYPLLRIKNRNKTFNKKDPKAYEKASEFLKEVRCPHLLHEVTVCEYMKLSKTMKHHLCGYRTSVEFPDKEQEIDAYMIGLWLGDGTSAKPHMTSDDEEIVDYLSEFVISMNMKISQGHNTQHHKGEIGYYLAGKRTGKGNNPLLNFLKKYDLINNKHIPHHYKCNSREKRLRLLAGLIDTDGSLGNGTYYEITQKNNQLANDIVFLARSLGYYVSKIPTYKYCMYKGEKRGDIYQRMNICSTRLADISEIPVILTRKVAPIREHIRVNYDQYKFTLEKAHVGDYYGIEIDGNHRFVLGDFTVVRNCLEPDTLVRMYDGTLKKARAIQEGDMLMGDDNTPRKVSGLANGQDEMYRITQEIGDAYIVNQPHILSLYNKQDQKIEDIPLTEYLLLANKENYQGIKNINGAYIRYNIVVDHLGKGEYNGFELDGNGRFLLADGTITHNTSLMENFAYYLKHRYPVARVLIGTEDGYKRMCKIFHPLFVSNYWSEEEEKRHIQRQRTCEMENGRAYQGNYAVNIIDDVSDDPKIYKTQLMRGIFKLGSQHWAQLCMIGAQYAIDFPPDVRKAVSYVAIGREPEEGERKKLYENFGGLAGSYNKFCDLMDQITGDYTFLIFKKRSQSNNLEDCVSWFRTKKMGDWKFGCKEYRKWGNDRYDPNFVEQIMM
jgi:hypothetical protein